jgi:5-methylcytosine-specific restriction endonuclease McrA
MKKCTGCGKLKSLDCFYKRNKKPRAKCKLCENITSKNWREKNKQYIHEYNIEYRKSNNEELKTKDRNKYLTRGKTKEYLKRRRDYYQKNKEKLCKYSAKWSKNNPEKHAENTRIRKQRQRNLTGNLTKESVEFRFRYYGYCCYYCGCNGCKLTIEHRIPISRGGTNHPSNIVPACRTCNSKKGTKTEKEFKKILDNAD